MKTSSRIAVLLAALTLIGTYFLPLWRIDLWAPQYPEGLVMKIWLSKLSGDVAIINGLNHYIGMAHIKEEMFPEFTYLPYIVGVYIGLGLLVALLGKFRLLAAYLGAIVLAGVVALYDFWQWGYEYGHNLDPKAPIQVPGMAYQPPIIGYKALLNFGAYSMPDVGGWLFILAGLIVATVTVREWFSTKKRMKTTQKRTLTTIAVLLTGLLAQGCNAQPDPIRYGQDACHHCKMTIVDQKFGTEFVTRKGKAFKFDDVSCMANYLREANVPETDIALLLVNDFGHPGHLIDARKATFVQSPGLRSPMGGNTAGFASARDAEQVKGGKIVGWKEVIGY